MSDEKDNGWKTMPNGAKVYIEKGETLEDALKRNNGKDNEDHSKINGNLRSAFNNRKPFTIVDALKKVKDEVNGRKEINNKFELIRYLKTISKEIKNETNGKYTQNNKVNIFGLIYDQNILDECKKVLNKGLETKKDGTIYVRKEAKDGTGFEHISNSHHQFCPEDIHDIPKALINPDEDYIDDGDRIYIKYGTYGIKKNKNALKVIVGKRDEIESVSLISSYPNNRKK